LFHPKDREAAYQLMFSCREDDRKDHLRNGNQPKMLQISHLTYV
jgi:hypothetical protein